MQAADAWIDATVSLAGPCEQRSNWAVENGATVPVRCGLDHTQDPATYSGACPVAAVISTTIDRTAKTCSYSGRWRGSGITTPVTPHPSRAPRTAVTSSGTISCLPPASEMLAR